MKHQSFVDGLVTILEKKEVIKPKESEALKNAFKDSQKPYFDDFLLDEGIVPKDDLFEALAEYFQVPYFDVVGYFFDHNLVRMFPQEIMISNAFIPIERDENMLIVVASNPNDSELLPIIGEYVSYDIHFRVGIRSDITGAIQEYYEPSLAEVNYDDDLDNDRVARIEGDEKEEEVEEIAYEDFEQDEK